MARIIKGLLIVVFSTSLVVGCGSSSDDDSGSSGTSVGGTPTKGPLVGAVVNAYAFDASAIDFKGVLLDSGETNNAAAIIGLVIPPSHSGAVILEVVADGDTTDMTTGQPPVITQLLTVTTTSVLGASPVYPSPLSTIAFRLAGTNGDSSTAPYSGDGNGTLTEAEFLSGFGVASRQTVSTLGFGLDPATDLNTTPPLVTDATTTAAQQAQVAAIRTAIEAITAVVANMQDDAEATNATTASTPNALLAGLAEDLADGDIDGANGANPVAAFNDVQDGGNPSAVSNITTANPENLVIPNTNPPVTVGDVEDVLIDETSDTGTSTNTDELNGGSAEVTPGPAQTEPDSDGDGDLDSADNCPLDENADQADLDMDDIGDVCDDDKDGDGDNNDVDNCPVDANADQADQDGDEIGDVCDADRDGDGVENGPDNCPDDANANQQDTDTDMIGNVCDPDADGDGQNNDVDTDDDGDTTLDVDDAFPLDPDEDTDTDTDGVGDNGDNCPNVANPDQTDSDGDGEGNACDTTPNGGDLGAVWDQFNWDNANWQ